MTLPDFGNVSDAADKLAGIAVATPTLEFPFLNERVGTRVLLKPEIFQITGSDIGIPNAVSRFRILVLIATSVCWLAPFRDFKPLPKMVLKRNMAFSAIEHV